MLYLQILKGCLVYNSEFLHRGGMWHETMTSSFASFILFIYLFYFYFYFFFLGGGGVLCTPHICFNNKFATLILAKL